MKGIQKHIKSIRIVFIILFAALAFYFIYAVNVYGGRWLNNPYNRRLEEQKSKVVAGSIYDRNGTVLAYTDADGERRYSDDRARRLAISHVVGDGSGLTSTGAESFMANYLLGFQTNVFERIYQQFSGGARGSNIQLTIDADLSTSISEAMGNYDGSVVVLNYKTGEIISMVSHPMYDPNIIVSEGTGSFAQSALVNRATMGRYTPGSVFKVVTATAGLRYLPDASERTWTDYGPLAYDIKTRKFVPSISITAEEDKKLREEKAKATPKPTIAPTDVVIEDGEMVPLDETESAGILDQYVLLRNYQSNYYEEVTLERAMSKSTNGPMARIAMEVGGKKMTKVAKGYGFNTDFAFSDLIMYSSQYEHGDNDYELSWSAVGQYKDLVTPLHMAMIAGSIGNDGVMMEPKLLRSVINVRDKSTLVLKPKEFRQPISASEAATLTQEMRTVITSGTGTSADISGVEVCGKTGTAEVSSDKNIGNHAWFIGFIDDEDHPLAISVILEHAGSGGAKAAPVAKQALQRALRLGY